MPGLLGRYQRRFRRVDIQFLCGYYCRMLLRPPANQDIPGSSEWAARLEAFGGLDFVVAVARRASAVIMQVYSRPFVQQHEKEDRSPVSEADLAAASLIERELSVTGIPVVCEESVSPEATAAPIFWLVDPLDGTKEFLAKNGEFTVNIALVSGGVPVLGVIAIPVSGEVYGAVKGCGALRIVGETAAPIRNTRTTTSLVAAISRSHGSDAGDRWLSSHGITKRVHCGSAIKFCRVAEGVADLYVRFGRTMEWDTAAGHCILEESGCKLIVADSGERLQYGKAGFDNPSFVACRQDLTFDATPLSPAVGNL